MLLTRFVGPAIYALIVCAHSQTPCEAQKAVVQSITRDECIERLQLFRWTHPEQRLVCLSVLAQDVIDTDELDQPEKDEDFEILP